MSTKIKSENGAEYTAVKRSGINRFSEETILRAAADILYKRFSAAPMYSGNSFTTPDSVKQYLALELGNLEHEVFAVMYLDNRHHLIDCVHEFKGTIDGASVYPREIAKSALKHNAAAVIFAHNHPSGLADPSAADIRLTERLKTALSLFDIRVLDHVIVGANQFYSFAESGSL